MRSIWREIESAIDKVVEKYAKDESSRERIENGEHSALYEKFGINFEKTQNRWCFRSARANELDISYIDDAYIYPDRMNDIEKFIVQMMSNVRSAINNTYDFVKECNSYSKYLAAPLFKFKNGNNPLIIDKLDLNTINISVDVSCFDWIGEGTVSYDRFGNEQNRYHVEDCFFSIPFRELFSKSRIIEAIVDEIEDIKDSRNGMMDVYDISALAFLDMTLDISAVDRPALDRFYNEYKGTKFFRYASYVKDWEVLSTRKNPSYDGMVIRDSRAVQLVRFIYLLKVANLYTGDTCVFIRDVLLNRYSDIIAISLTDCKAIEWILEYLQDQEKFRDERAVFGNTFQDIYWYNGRPVSKEGFEYQFNEIGGFDKEFGNFLLSKTFE